MAPYFRGFPELGGGGGEKGRMYTHSLPWLLRRVLVQPSVETPSTGRRRPSSSLFFQREGFQQGPRRSPFLHAMPEERGNLNSGTGPSVGWGWGAFLTTEL